MVVVVVVAACGQDGEHSLIGLAYFEGIFLLESPKPQERSAVEDREGTRRGNLFGDPGFGGFPEREGKRMR